MAKSDTRKEDFINDYVDAALASPHESRAPNEIHSDAEVEWESKQIDLATERYKQARVANGQRPD